MLTKYKKRLLLLFISLIIIFSIVYIITISFEKKDINQQWYLDNKGQTIGFRTGVNGEDINFSSTLQISDPNSIIAIMDVGVNFNFNIQTNQFINENEIPNNGIDDDGNGFIDDISGWDFYNNDNSQYDNLYGASHGTSLINILVGRDGNKYIPLIDNVSILSIKVFEGESYRISGIIEGIEYAEQLGASILIMSFELLTYNESVYTKMRNSDMFFVCSAGNNNSIEVNYPAKFNLDNMIVVGVIANNGYPYEKTNFGSFVDIYAPAKDIYSIDSYGEYHLYSGTSYAVPQVAAIAYYLHETFNIQIADLKAQIILNSRISSRAYLNNEYVRIIDYCIITEMT